MWCCQTENSVVVKCTGAPHVLNTLRTPMTRRVWQEASCQVMLPSSLTRNNEKCKGLEGCADSGMLMRWSICDLAQASLDLLELCFDSGYVLLAQCNLLLLHLLNTDGYFPALADSVTMKSNEPARVCTVGFRYDMQMMYSQNKRLAMEARTQRTSITHSDTCFSGML